MEINNLWPLPCRSPCRTLQITGKILNSSIVVKFALLEGLVDLEPNLPERDTRDTFPYPMIPSTLGSEIVEAQKGLILPRMVSVVDRIGADLHVVQDLRPPAHHPHALPTPPPPPCRPKR